MSATTKIQCVLWGLIALSIGGLFVWRMTHPQQSGQPQTAEPPVVAEEFGRQAPQFTLTGTDGRPFSSRSLEGKIWVVSFFYTTCPGPCVELNYEVAALQEEFTDPSLKFVSITANPATDTPEKLGEYAKKYEADPERWIFLTGDAQDISDIAQKGFLVSAGIPSNNETHPITHSDRLIVVDHQGTIRGAYQSRDDYSVQRLKLKLREVLREKKRQTSPRNRSTSPKVDKNSQPVEGI